MKKGNKVILLVLVFFIIFTGFGFASEPEDRYSPEQSKDKPIIVIPELRIEAISNSWGEVSLRYDDHKYRNNS